MARLPVKTITYEVARDLAVKAFDPNKMPILDKDPESYGKAVGKFFNAILDTITKE